MAGRAREARPPRRSARRSAARRLPRSLAPWELEEATDDDQAASPPADGASSRTLAACVFFNVLCGLTNGYDICVTSTLLDSMVADLGLCGGGPGRGEGEGAEAHSCPGKQAIMSLAAAGSLLAKVFLPWVADRYGRRWALAVVDVAIVSAVALQVTAREAARFFAGRLLLGAGLGLAFMVEPMYVCEIAPPARRGQFVIMNEAAVCVGCLLGLEVGAAVVRGGSAAAGAWRLAVALGAVPAAVQLFFIFTLPESPRWLALHGDTAGLAAASHRLGLSAKEVRDLMRSASKDDEECQELEGFPPMEGLLRWLRRLCRVQRAAWKAHSSSFLVALCFFFFTAASGISGMQSYAFDILLVSGVAEPLRLLPLVGWVKLAGSLIAAASADSPRVGRRVLAVVGSCSCMLCDAALAVHLAMPGLLPPAVPATALFVFIFGWNVGFGSLQFVVSLEVLPNEVRSTWSGQIYALVGLVEIALLQLFETMLLTDGSVAFLAFAAINLAAVAFSCCVMPDLGGRSLEEAPAQCSPPSPARGELGDVGSCRSLQRYGQLGDAGEETPVGAPAPAVVGAPALGDGI